MQRRRQEEHGPGRFDHVAERFIAEAGFAYANIDRAISATARSVQDEPARGTCHVAVHPGRTTVTNTSHC